MIDLRWSEATIDWLPICEPALRSLRRAADKLELTDLCEALDRFSGSLGEATASARERCAGARAATRCLARYEELGRLMPQAVALDLDRSQREAAILQSLLLQVRASRRSRSTGCTRPASRPSRRCSSRPPADIAATTSIPRAARRR